MTNRTEYITGRAVFHQSLIKFQYQGIETKNLLQFIISLSIVIDTTMNKKFYETDNDFAPITLKSYTTIMNYSDYFSTIHFTTQCSHVNNITSIFSNRWSRMPSDNIKNVNITCVGTAQRDQVRGLRVSLLCLSQIMHK